MKAIRVLKSMGPIDARGILRDSTLVWVAAAPFLLTLVLRFGVPFLGSQLLLRFGFDLSPYYPIFISFMFILMFPLLFGMMSGFLMLDENDDHTRTALQVTPMSVQQYLAYRLLTPMALSLLLMIIFYPLLGISEISFWEMLVVAIIAMPFAVIFALLLVTFSGNKVQGFAMTKGIGGVFFVPALAFFIQSKWTFLFGLLPSYWPMKVYWMMGAGDPHYWIYVLVGLVYQAIVLAGLIYIFIKKQFR